MDWSPVFARDLAPIESIEYAWVDTCCIDKRSSSELSEAINSMWKWYAEAAICVAYLCDVFNEDSPSKHQLSSAVSKSILASEWFGRGWTLQELLASPQIVFCDVAWSVLGLKVNITDVLANDLPKLISEALGIPSWYLSHELEVVRRKEECMQESLPSPERFRMASIAQRMSWASQRRTTRAEDMAYCLFGLFEINLPRLYGEGQRAFRRLQEELIRQSNDESIFAWSFPETGTPDSGILAGDPSWYRNSGHLHNVRLMSRMPYAITNKGVEISAPLLQVSRNDFILQLNCVSIGDIAGSHGVSSYGPEYSAYGCSIVLRRGEDGSFVRRHVKLPEIDVAQAAAGDGYTARCIVETLLYVHAFTAYSSVPGLDSHWLAGRVRIAGNDTKWDKSQSDSWYARLHSKSLEPGMFTLQGVRRDEQQETWDRWLRHIKLRESHAISDSRAAFR